MSRPDEEMMRRWRHVESFLRAVICALEWCEGVGPETLKEAAEYLDHNELGLAYDALKEATSGNVLASRLAVVGSVQMNLEAAAAIMSLGTPGTEDRQMTTPAPDAPARMMPFIYRVCRQDPNCNRHAEHDLHQGENPKHGRDKFIVSIGRFDYTHQDMRWACDPKIGDSPLVPNIDVVHEEHEFDDENEALGFVREWWAKQATSKEGAARG